MYPQKFLDRMKWMLGEEYNEFLQSLQSEKAQALRINTLKRECGVFLEKSSFSLEPVPWAEPGYYYDASEAPGKHPYHEAGVYYIQEPSAMAPAQLLQVQPGERVLDLCAAPGGKSTQLAAAMKGQGILVCNEIHPARAKILSENVERMGIANAVVTNESPSRLAEIFSGYFDRILVDAPCSGEGMFRKNDAACEQWSEENVQLCAGRQDEILDCAARMLRPGGTMVYSTCTFAPEENEGSISRFLVKHKEFMVAEAEKKAGIADGVGEWAQMKAPGLERCVRLWPHKLRGEGHFAAVLQKEGEWVPGTGSVSASGIQTGLLEKDIVEYLAFKKEYLRTEREGIYLKFGEQLYLAPNHMPSVKGLKVLRPGLHLGTIRKNRFEPSHALALALQPEEAFCRYDLSSQEPQISHYLGGGTFQASGEKGWYQITVDGYGTGWGKLAGGIMKNHYPKGLRK